MIHTEEMFVEGNAKLIAVVQRHKPESDTWVEEGQLGGLTQKSFEKAAKTYLGLYRGAHPKLPRESSRVVRRTVTTFDEPMEW